MSLEHEIHLLTQAVNELTLKLQSLNMDQKPVIHNISDTSKPSTIENVPTVTFDQPTKEKTKAPFNDSKELIQYVMGSYKELGAEKGAMIQNVLAELGYSNINDIRSEHYLELFNGIENLKKLS